MRNLKIGMIVGSLSALCFVPALVIGYVNRPVDLPSVNEAIPVRTITEQQQRPPHNYIILDEVVVKSYRPLPRKPRKKEPELVEQCITQPSLVGGAVRICEKVSQ